MFLLNENLFFFLDLNADARFHPLNNLLYQGNSITASHLLSFSIEKIWFLVKVYLYFDKWEKNQ